MTNQGDSMMIPAVDMDQLKENYECDLDLICEVSGYFIKRGPYLMQLMRTAKKEKNLKTLKSSAHELTGMSVNLFALELAKLTSSVEVCLREYGEEVISTLDLETVSIELKRVVRYLEGFLNE